MKGDSRTNHPQELTGKLLIHRFGPIEHDDIADAGDQMAAALLRELWSKLLLLLLEMVKLDLDQFLGFERLIEGGEEWGAEALLAELERSLEPLRLGLESAGLRIAERKHEPSVGGIET